MQALYNGHAPAKRHGIGKGLMTVWRVANPESQSIPTGVDFVNEDSSCSRPKVITVKASMGSCVDVLS